MANRDPIKKVTLADGRTRYRFTIDVGEKADGRRDQRTFTYDNLREARAKRAKVISDRAAGTYVRPDKVTVAQLIDAWLAGKRNLGPGTRRTYIGALAHARDALGLVQVQKLTKPHVEKLITDMQVRGRRVGNKRRQDLGARTINNTLARFASVIDDAMKQGIVARNVVRLVDRPTETPTERQTWTADAAAAWLAAIADDRLAIAWMLSLYGLRRGEILGLRWSDIDLVKKTITVQWTRVPVGGDVIEKEPKTEKSKRTLPLDDDLVNGFTRLQLLQREERDKAGDAYAKPCEMFDARAKVTCAGDHVIVDELGGRYLPQWYSDRFITLITEHGAPRITLHGTRHTCGTLMHLRGVPIAMISAWLGHAKISFTMDTYVHAQRPALDDAMTTLRGAYKVTAESDVRDL